MRGETIRRYRIEAAESSGLLSPQLTAFFTSAPIFASSVAVSSFSAKEVGHMAPSSRFATSLKPDVAFDHPQHPAGQDMWVRGWQ